MKWLLLAVCSFVLVTARAQETDESTQLGFTRVLGSLEDDDPFLSIAEDRFGFLWFTRQLKGLQRYDGQNLKSFQHNPGDSNSLADNYVECMTIDSANIIWLGTYGSGLDRYDPRTNRFTHYRHNAKREGSLAADTISAILCDRAGNIWVGTTRGLDLLDQKTNTFRHFPHRLHDSTSLSNNDIRIIYEDHAGTIWVGTGRPFSNLDRNPEDGGLNRLDKSSGTFKRYMHNDKDSNSLSDNRVRAVFEDNTGRFWIGARGDGVQTLDRATGKFTHFPYNHSHPGLHGSAPPLARDGEQDDHVAFIDQDSRGNIMVGTWLQGLYYYNPSAKQVRHYGNQFLDNGTRRLYDSASGLTTSRLWKTLTTRDGQTWIITLDGLLYVTDATVQKFVLRQTLPGVPDANTFYLEPGDSILWIGGMAGLVRKNLVSGEMKNYRHDPRNAGSLCNDSVSCIRGDEQGALWIATANGLSRFDAGQQTFKNWQKISTGDDGLSDSDLTALVVDEVGIVWIGTANRGVNRFDPRTGKFLHFIRGGQDVSPFYNQVTSMSEDKQRHIWVGTGDGLIRLDSNARYAGTYIYNIVIRSVFTDRKGIVWASTYRNLHYYDSSQNNFQLLGDEKVLENVTGVIGIREDKNQNLWINASSSIIRIDSLRKGFRVFSKRNGIVANGFFNSDDLAADNGEMFIGSGSGYYSFFPDSLLDKRAPVMQLTDFLINEKRTGFGHGGALKTPLWQATTAYLGYDESNFSLEFQIEGIQPEGRCRYMYKLDNYDDKWRDIGSDHKAYFFNVPPGNYVFRVTGVTPDGRAAERTLSIFISPPWWKAWWAYVLYAIAVVFIVWCIVSVRSRSLQRTNRMLEQRVAVRTKQVREEKERAEKTLADLKTTQDQLVQSEKMASLGELTAGIAHEIQNPLNFVNNFSEVNAEMLNELGLELEKGNYEEAKNISVDLKTNEEKINYHGKRADAIVKGMLLHSRKDSGVREPVNLNALADEYLRLSYHGLRAKDKSFLVEMQTIFDPSLPMTTVVPQDMGRVFLNLFNNAFYAASSGTMRAAGEKAVVTVETKRAVGEILITVTDNGDGVPPQLKDKIFQPFFTTKAAGEGTGLGLSLSYDIISKGHGGTLTYTPVEPHGAKFLITIPEQTV